jgi:hypothetical protein
MDNSTQPRPVFVVGMNGSGTTMLLDSLGRHPELYAFPRETRLIPHLFATQKGFGDLRSDDNFFKLWNTVLGLGVFEYVNDHQPLEIPADWRSYPRSLAGVLDGVFGLFAAREGKQRWCEKTPQYIQHMPLLLELFPEARFVHVIRDGRDCAASFNRRWLRTPELTMYRWKKVVAEGHMQGKLLGEDKYMEVRYEDLTANPEVWLRRICEFIGVPFDAAITESSQPYLNSDRVAAGLVPNSGKWKTYFDPEKLRVLEQIGGSALASFGYPTDFPDSSVNLSALQRKGFAARDSVAQYVREIGLKLSGKIERPWSVILGRPFVAIRQRRQNRY